MWIYGLHSSLFSSGRAFLRTLAFIIWPVSTAFLLQCFYFCSQGRMKLRLDLMWATMGPTFSTLYCSSAKIIHSHRCYILSMLRFIACCSIKTMFLLTQDCMNPFADVWPPLQIFLYSCCLLIYHFIHLCIHFFFSVSVITRVGRFAS